MRLTRHIPNTITSMNLLCGIFGVIVTLQGRVDLAFLLMLGAAVCDFCDGLAARLLHAYSDIGKELDSLADMVSFGVLPSLILHQLMAYQVRGWVTFLPLILAVFAALRLACFNTDERQHDSFIGLPTPAAAMICGSLAYYVYNEPFTVLAEWCGTVWFLPVLAVILSVLMVCGLPMFSMKFGGQKNQLATTKRTALLSVSAIILIMVAVLKFNWSMAVLMIFTAYILMNLCFYCFKATRHSSGAFFPITM